MLASILSTTVFTLALTSRIDNGISRKPLAWTLRATHRYNKICSTDNSSSMTKSRSSTELDGGVDSKVTDRIPTGAGRSIVVLDALFVVVDCNRHCINILTYSSR